MKTLSRIQQLFQNGKAYTAYLTAGDGGVQSTLDAALALIKGGVNMLEIGVPFSDPIADGLIIQRASQRSLAKGTCLADVLWITKQIRQQSDIPIILFSYLNPILSALPSDFLPAAKNAGIDGLLLVDCPLEASDFIHQQCNKNDIALIYVIAPSTPLTRIKIINTYAQGFLYYACQKGTTGLRNELPKNFREKINTLKSMVDLPVIVGFGISNQEAVYRVLQYADGVVVGSLFVKALEEGASPSTLTKLAQNLYPKPVHN
ncbi:tryptophan synthase subunit alpha [Rickettsiella endosymbiont of Miltochrista miniata]|uniref:tryptophan synthase subunit alpha n=1 Tax=Rickettsiella endosymbiont of Miltochrista miniata TaxID=3066239 RepID=UPI00313F16E4